MNKLVRAEPSLSKKGKKLKIMKSNYPQPKLKKPGRPDTSSFPTANASLLLVNNSNNKRKCDSTTVDMSEISPLKKLQIANDDLTCNICNINFDHESLRFKHMETFHKSSKPSKPKNADHGEVHTNTPISSAMKQKAHRKDHHSSGGMKKGSPKRMEHTCPQCDQRFESKTNLKKHMNECSSRKKQVVPGPPGPVIQTHQTNVVIFCEECGIEYDNREDLTKHINSTECGNNSSNSPEKPVVHHQELEDDDDDLEEIDEVELEEDMGPIVVEDIKIQEKIDQLSLGVNRTHSQSSKYFVKRNFNTMIREEESSEDEDDDMEISSDEEEVVLDDPEVPEITIDDNTDLEGEVQVEEYSKEKEMIEKYEDFLTNAPRDKVLSVVDDEQKMKNIWPGLWWAQPSSWRPSTSWETWNATVKQICTFYKLKDVPLQPGRRYKSYREFDQEISAQLKMRNPNKAFVPLYKLKKAKWLQTLDPVIPDNMKIVEESIDDDDDDM